MRRVYALSFLLFVLRVVGISSRAEASVVNIFNPTYEGSALAANDPFNPIINFSQIGNFPVSFSQSFPSFGGIGVSASGGINPGGSGSVQSAASIIQVPLFLTSANASTTINFDISEPSVINLTCSAFALGFGTGGAGFRDLTTGQSLLSCFAAFAPTTGSGSFLLNPADLYQLSTFATLPAPDSNSGSLNFSIPGVTEVNIFLPEPSVICLLGIALLPLGLLHRSKK